MKFLERIFDVFSRRPDAVEKPLEFPEESRLRVFLWVEDVYSNERSNWGQSDYRYTFWEEVHKFLQHRHGRYVLSGRPGLTEELDSKSFLLKCDTPNFLDFLEYVFRVRCFFHVSLPVDQVVEELNEILRVGDLPFHMTPYVERKVVGEQTGPVALGGGATYIEVAAFPTVVLRENEVLHSESIQPALELLKRPSFHAANDEFLRALVDYRKGDWADCVAKCCSALESAMKVVCEEKKWTYNETDAAAKLVRTILKSGNLPPFFEQGLLSVPTLRNKVSSAHGGGTVARSPTKPIAHYSVNATATAIVFIAEATGLQ